jgi:hypothetical protein
MAAPLERFGHGTFGRFRRLSRSERADPFHQVVAEPDAEAVRLAGGEPAAACVLSEAVLGRVGGLPDVERCQRARLGHGVSRQLDDVNTVDAGSGLAHAPRPLTGPAPRAPRESWSV